MAGVTSPIIIVLLVSRHTAAANNATMATLVYTQINYYYCRHKPLTAVQVDQMPPEAKARPGQRQPGRHRRWPLAISI